MVVLIAGGTGFVGREIAGSAIRSGHRVRCLARGTRGEVSLRPGVTSIYGDISDPDSLIPAFEEVDILVHAVGIIREAGGSTFRAIHTEGTKNLVRMAQRAAVEKIVYISALGTRADGASAYHRTKWEAEQTVVGSGMDYTIFRPSVIFGPDDGFVNMLARMIRFNPVVPVIGSGQYRLQPVSVKDIARLVVDALEHEDARNRIFEVGGPEQFAYDEILDIICQVSGRRRLKVHLPLTLMKPVVQVAEWVLPKPPVTMEQLTMLQEDNTCDVGPLKETFQIELTLFRRGISEYLR